MPKPPKFRDYRATYDGVMIADVGFKKQLWELDPSLDVVWDWAGEKWEIWRFPGQEKKALKNQWDPRAMHVMTVQTKTRKFRELGADIILKLQAGDTTKFSTKQLMAYFDKMDDNIKRAKRRDLVNKVQAMAYDTFNYARGVLQVQVPKRFQCGIPLKGPDQKLKVAEVFTNG